MPFYIGGDQTHYRQAYELLSDLNLVEGYELYFSKLSSREYIHFLLSWLASKFIEKDLFIAIFNGILAYVTMSVLHRWKASVFISFSIVIPNYYFMVLYFSAERLKFALIFLLLSLLYSKNKTLFYPFAFLSIITHVQVLIIYVSIAFNKFFVKTIKMFRTGMLPKYFFLVFLIIIPTLLVKNQIFNKLQYYSNVNGLAELSKGLVFLSLAIWYSNKKIETVLIFTPVLFAVFILGGSRLNMFAYFIFLHYGFQCRGGWNFGVLATLLYFSYSSIDLLSNILSYGDGFWTG
jgi:hypothetical protein